ncbi:hypothetical protein K439DRAFT_1665070 [Ramaria rubella]|nr:hypothetical protein K439DRAFT_1665070 [Ramaria rubella]
MHADPQSAQESQVHPRSITARPRPSLSVECLCREAHAGGALGTAPDLGRAETPNAAEKAFVTWTKMSAKYRHHILLILAQLVYANTEVLGRIILFFIKDFGGPDVKLTPAGSD